MLNLIIEMSLISGGANKMLSFFVKTWNLNNRQTEVKNQNFIERNEGMETRPYR